jgi:hypothetical protein
VKKNSQERVFQSESLPEQSYLNLKMKIIFNGNEETGVS